MIEIAKIQMDAKNLADVKLMASLLLLQKKLLLLRDKARKAAARQPAQTSGRGV